MIYVIDKINLNPVQINAQIKLFITMYLCGYKINFKNYTIYKLSFGLTGI
jgi:hypothetical protein